ncbi:hyperosmotically inducible protein [Luteibacter rhizovicinus]|uniref:Hyperosmotically inducible protein n=1 Tax=Luteibacter rhizovicinus TaxID=242606 RepID=A0A4R3YSD0_9GAMM|nr:BON domain-containing protein [Luteibacter rhizovicinus]TCV94194.1 hyperosmotically inducible protein [Luteibacter rhizovicinus]
MNHATIRKALFAAALVTGLGAVPFAQVSAQDSAAKTSDNQTVPGKADDAWITTKVKSEFATKKAVHGSDISVTTTEGVVALTGSVTTAKEKTNAEKIAKAVKGVKSVDASGLTVAPAADAK